MVVVHVKFPVAGVKPFGAVVDFQVAGVKPFGAMVDFPVAGVGLIVLERRQCDSVELVVG